MKYFLILILSLAFSQPVLAAKTVSGTVPVVQPLQPPSMIAHPNLSGNVQFQGTSQPSSTGLSADSNMELNPNSLATATNNSVPSIIVGHSYWFLGAVILLLILGWLAYKQNQVK